MTERDRTTEAFPQIVLWMRGAGCRELADLLAHERAVQVTGDPLEEGVRHRADMVVMKAVGSLDLLPVAAPEGFDPTLVGHVVAAVADGPHSAFASIVAGRLAARLDVSVEAITAVRPGEPRAEARRTLDRARSGAGIDGRVVEAESAAGLLEAVPSSTLLVLGASGGSWLHRQFFGPGARLRAHAPAGTIVVRDAPARAFQFMTEPVGISKHLRVADALGALVGSVSAVTHEGSLVGIVRRDALVEAPPDAEIGDVMEEPAFVEASDAVESLAPVLEFYEGSSIPLVDRRGKLVGLLDPADLPAPS